MNQSPDATTKSSPSVKPGGGSTRCQPAAEAALGKDASDAMHTARQVSPSRLQSLRGGATGERQVKALVPQSVGHKMDVPRARRQPHSAPDSPATSSLASTDHLSQHHWPQVPKPTPARYPDRPVSDPGTAFVSDRAVPSDCQGVGSLARTNRIHLRPFVQVYVRRVAPLGSLHSNPARSGLPCKRMVTARWHETLRTLTLEITESL